MTDRPTAPPSPDPRLLEAAGNVRRRLRASMDEWIDVTGIVGRGTSYYGEMTSFCDDAGDLAAMEFAPVLAAVERQRDAWKRYALARQAASDAAGDQVPEAEWKLVMSELMASAKAVAALAGGGEESNG
jgi:hypothetical protein